MPRYHYVSQSITRVKYYIYTYISLSLSPSLLLFLTLFKKPKTFVKKKTIQLRQNYSNTQLYRDNNQSDSAGWQNSLTRLTIKTSQTRTNISAKAKDMYKVYTEHP